MKSGRTAPPGPAAVLLSGAAFGAAAAFLGAGVLAGSWPRGWAALVCALVLAALGATVLAVRSRSRTAPGVPPAADTPGRAPGPARGPARTGSAPDLTTTGSVQGPARTGRLPLVSSAALWALALLASGLWAVGSGDDEDDDRAEGRPGARPTATTGLDPRPAVAWQVPGAGQKYDEAVGAWGLGSTVAQGRIDGLFAYDGTTGAVRWSVPAPARQASCAMSPDAEEGIGLLAFGRHEQPCAALLAVRTADGEVLWRRDLPGDGLTGGLAVGGATAVSAEEKAVRARSTATGKQSWQRPHGKGCALLAMDADATRTLLVEQCGERARLLALDTRTGAERWSRDLPVESGASASVVSVSPVVVAVDEEDQRGTHAVLAFDERGNPRGSVPLAGPEGILSVHADVGDGDPARPLVLGDLLITLSERGELVPDIVVAHSLADGRKVWSHRAERQTMALAAEPDGTVGVLENEGVGHVLLLDSATGKVRDRIAPDTDPDTAPDMISIRPELVPVKGGHVVLNQILMQAEPAAFALR
ncbi:MULTISPECIES: PQQ-binding-like beta-propeller repeat protein [unclassified Streptomyces]|uniref:outer membrane protein assembly factor BamB family protein n=1 Tax=unclassified Streptomyces TaxID=2593676 RepID=UPI00382284FE